jgi:hypothetical protein
MQRSKKAKMLKRHAMRGDIEGRKEVQRACKSMSPTLDRGLTTPSGGVRSFRGANRPRPWGLPSSLRQVCSRSVCESTPREGDRGATARFGARFKALSLNRTTPQVDQAMHTEAFAEFTQFRAAEREETAQQPIPAKLLDRNPPALGATARPLENPGELCRDRSLSLAKKAAGVVDQLGTHQPISLERSPSSFSWGTSLLYATPVAPSRSFCRHVVNYHRRHGLSRPLSTERLRGARLSSRLTRNRRPRNACPLAPGRLGLGPADHPR